MKTFTSPDEQVAQRIWELGIAGFISSSKTSAFCFYQLTVLAALFHFNVISQNFKVSMKFSAWFSFIVV